MIRNPRYLGQLVPDISPGQSFGSQSWRNEERSAPTAIAIESQLDHRQSRRCWRELTPND
jgi:hypothetical protein